MIASFIPVPGLTRDPGGPRADIEAPGQARGGCAGDGRS